MDDTSNVDVTDLESCVLRRQVYDFCEKPKKIQISYIGPGAGSLVAQRSTSNPKGLSLSLSTDSCLWPLASHLVLIATDHPAGSG